MLLSAALVLCQPAAVAQTTGPVPSPVDQGDNPAPKAVEVRPAADDAAIASRIQRILEFDNLVSNSARSGAGRNRILDGKTDTQEHWRWAGTLAQNTQGAVAVVNRIEVEADVGSTFGRAGDEFVNIYRQAIQAWPWVALAFVIILVTWLLARVVAVLARRFFSSRVSSSLLLAVIIQVFSIPIFLLGIYFVLQVAGLTRLALTVLGGTGLIGIIVGFAFRDIAENFLASIILSVRNPFSTGDLIEVDGFTGIVQNLNIRTTVLLTLDGSYVQIPNAIVFKSTIKNFSGTTSRRADFAVGISYDSATTKAQMLIANVLKEHPAVLDVPEPLVLVEELGAATVNLRIFYWFASATYSPDKINSALLRLTKDALLKGGIELPDPAREVVFPRGVPVFRVGGSEDSKRGRTEGTGHVQSGEEEPSATLGEGGLRNETAEVSKQSERKAPEAQENLLKR